MKAIKIFLLAGLFALTARAAAQEPAFQAGEELVYAGKYRVGPIEPNMATVTFTIGNSTVDNVPAYTITAVGEVSPKFKWFFDMRDEYNSYLDRATLKPIHFRNSIKEGTYRLTSEYFYDWNNNEVTTQWKNLRDNVVHEKTMPLTERTFDAVAMFFNLRGTISGMQPGEFDYIDVVMKDTVKHLRYKYIGPEERNIASMGRYRTHKFSCQLTNSTDERDAFPDGTEFFIWFSDDKNRIPLYLETPIRIGTVKCTLLSVKGLKYPLGGKIR